MKATSSFASFLMPLLALTSVTLGLEVAQARFGGALADASQADASIQLKMEQIVGRSLSEQEQAGLGQVIALAQEPTVQNASTQNQAATLTKNLYCVGSSLSVGISMMIAACLHGPSWRVYTVRMPVGVGVGLHAVLIQPFWLSVTHAADFAKEFDPVVGSYHLATANISLVLGQVSFTGSSGNKSVTGRGINLIALGYEVTPFGLLEIE